MPLSDTGCRVLSLFMLVTKLRVLTGAAVIALSALFSPLEAQAGCGYASHYGKGDNYGGQITANGERMNPYAMTAAHPYLPMGTRLRVSHKGRSVVVRINDRGPYAAGRTLDLSYAAFAALAPPSRGEISVCYARV